MTRDLALQTLINYRTAIIVNDWRMEHLHNAQRCVGRIVLALALLLSGVFWAVTAQPPAYSFIS